MFSRPPPKFGGGRAIFEFRPLQNIAAGWASTPTHPHTPKKSKNLLWLGVGEISIDFFEAICLAMMCLRTFLVSMVQSTVIVDWFDALLAYGCFEALLYYGCPQAYFQYVVVEALL